MPDRPSDPRLDAAANELYGLPPEEFTAARDRAARALRRDDLELAAAVRALRRPAVAAWAVNALVRSAPAELENLLRLSDALRAAVAAGAGADVRRLSGDRRRALDALGRASAGAVGRALPPAVSAEVAGTLEAASADPEVAAEVLSGRLVRPVRYAGFGSAPAGTRPAPPRPAAKPARAARPPAGTARAVALRAAEAAARGAAGAADDAQQGYAARAGAAAAAEQAVAAAAAEWAELRDLLAAAAQRLDAARRSARTAAEGARAGRRKAADAHAAAARARRHLDDLRRGGDS